MSVYIEVAASGEELVPSPLSSLELSSASTGCAVAAIALVSSPMSVRSKPSAAA